jgi:hypothetical protein
LYTVELRIGRESETANSERDARTQKETINKEQIKSRHVVNAFPLNFFNLAF